MFYLLDIYRLTVRDAIKQRDAEQNYWDNGYLRGIYNLPYPAPRPINWELLLLAMNTASINNRFGIANNYTDRPVARILKDFTYFMSLRVILNIKSTCNFHSFNMIDLETLMSSGLQGLKFTLLREYPGMSLFARVV